MAKKTKAQNKGQNQEQPVDAEIRAAAKRIGIPVDAYIEQERARRFGEETQLTFSLKELCDAIGYEVHPDSFAADAFERIAQQVEAEAGTGAHDADDDRWHRLQSIAERANFAARVVRKLQETEVAS